MGWLGQRVEYQRAIITCTEWSRHKGRSSQTPLELKADSNAPPTLSYTFLEGVGMVQEGRVLVDEADTDFLPLLLFISKPVPQAVLLRKDWKRLVCSGISISRKQSLGMDWGWGLRLL